MVAHRRVEYVRRSLPRLLETCDEFTRVWLWHNGDDVPTLDLVSSFSAHPRVWRFHHSPVNRPLREPTNWLWQNATGELLGKVDDDCLVPSGWIETLRRAHHDVDVFGAIGCWEYPDEDFDPTLAARKIQEFHGHHRLLRNLWIGGSSYLLKRRCVDEHGLIKPGESFPRYLMRLSREGWIHGWYYPFLRQEHMDDPRSPFTLLKTDEDVRRDGGLMVQYNGCSTIEAWVTQIRRSARLAQTAPLDPKHYDGWRRWLRGIQRRGRRLLGVKRQW